jgi:hypothetical protein
MDRQAWPRSPHQTFVVDSSRPDLILRPSTGAPIPPPPQQEQRSVSVASVESLSQQGADSGRLSPYEGDSEVHPVRFQASQNRTYLLINVNHSQIPRRASRNVIAYGPDRQGRPRTLSQVSRSSLPTQLRRPNIRSALGQTIHNSDNGFIQPVRWAMFCKFQVSSKHFRVASALRA